MNYAEGKGPQQVKATWPLGQFITIYGNGDPSKVNAAATPYPTTVVSGGVPGSFVPGLNLNVNGNKNTAIGYVCAPGSSSSVQDVESSFVTLTAESGFSGSALVTVQGTADRYNNAPSNWVPINSVTVGSGNVPYSITLVPSGVAWNGYRVVASGNATGIIDWAITGMFVDMSAMGIGANATDANGHLGQMSLQSPRHLVLSSGIVVTIDPEPVANVKANATFIG